MELLVVLVVMAFLAGALFPLGSVLKQRAHTLNRKADSLRYQAAFLAYFDAYGHFPACFPCDQWFNINAYRTLFITHFSGRTASNENPDAIEFCTFTASEWTTQALASVHIFLCHRSTPLEAARALPSGEKVYGSRVLFYVDKADSN